MNTTDGFERSNGATETNASADGGRVAYTDEELLQQLRDCKDKHGKASPNVFDTDEDFASSSTVMRHFESWLDAKEAAGVTEDLSGETGRKREYTNEQIISDLETCYERNGKVTTETLRSEDDLVSPTTIVERDEFESWMDAKKQAGVPEDERESNAKPRDYTDEQYLEMLRRCEEKHGEVTQRTFNDDDEFASAAAIRKRFDKWSKAKRKAGLETNTGGYTNEELLEHLRACQEKHGKCTVTVFSKDDEFPAPETVQRRFDRWSLAKEKAGID